MFAPSPLPFIALMAVGFLVGVAGHVYGSAPVVATGIGLVFLATVALPLVLYAAD